MRQLIKTQVVVDCRFHDSRKWIYSSRRGCEQSGKHEVFSKAAQPPSFPQPCAATLSIYLMRRSHSEGLISPVGIGGMSSLRSNSSGDRYPKAECSRFWL